MTQKLHTGLGSINILGVMTGTSCDAVDLHCVGVSSEGAVVRWKESFPYDADLRMRVFAVGTLGISHHELVKLDQDLGVFLGEVIALALSRHRIKPSVIAMHGQTVFHEGSFKAAQRSLTLQLGNPHIVAYMTSKTVTCQFRQGDIAAYGQGAPLVPKYHALLVESLCKEIMKHWGYMPKSVALQNLGGVSNLTYLVQGKVVLAFDTGPANMWIDETCRRISHGKLQMDRGGKMAAQGSVHFQDIKHLLKHPFFKKKPPKSASREDFPIEYFLHHTQAKGVDMVATATEFTAYSIAQAYQKWILNRNGPLEAIILCGGGACNPTLVRRIGHHMSIPVIPIQKLKKDPLGIEAEAFAWLGFLTLLGQPLGGPWTHAQPQAPTGMVVPGQNWNHVVGLLHQMLG